MKCEYALYEGEKFVTLGTIEEISQETGIEEKKLRYHTRPSLRKRYKNGLSVIKIEEEDNGL